MPHVDNELVVPQKVGSNDCLVHVRDDKDPAKGTSEANVKSHRVLAVGPDCRFVHRSENRRVRRMASLSQRRRKDTDLGASVDKIADFGDTVGDVEEATGSGAGKQLFFYCLSRTQEFSIFSLFIQR